MQKINIIITFTILSAIAVACGSASGEQGLANKKRKLKELQNKYIELKAEIAKLEEEIKAEDPDYREEKSAVLVSAVNMEPKTFTHTVEIRGAIASKKNVMLAAQAMGKIESIHVTEGQRVAKGQVLVSLDADLVRNNIRQVQAQLNLAKEVFERQERLWKQKIGTEVRYLEAKANKETLESQLAMLQSQLDMMIVKAPFAGVVDNIPAKVGEIAQPGMPLIQLVNPDDNYILAEVSESFLGKFSPGQEVSVYFPVQKKTIKSKIKSVGQTIKAENRTFELEVYLPKLNFPVSPNQIVVLTLVDYVNDNALVVPTEVILGDNGGTYLYVVDDSGEAQVAKRRSVKLGKSSKAQTEIIGGLKPGDRVVVKGHRDLSDGLQVSVVNQS